MLLAVGEDGWRWRGRATNATVAWVDYFHIFLIKTEFWIVGVVGGGQSEEEHNSKYRTRNALIRRKLAQLHWAKKIAQTPKYLCSKNYRKAI